MILFPRLGSLRSQCFMLRLPTVHGRSASMTAILWLPPPLWLCLHPLIAQAPMRAARKAPHLHRGRASCWACLDVPRGEVDDEGAAVTVRPRRALALDVGRRYEGPSEGPLAAARDVRDASASVGAGARDDVPCCCGGEGRRGAAVLAVVAGLRRDEVVAAEAPRPLPL